MCMFGVTKDDPRLAALLKGDRFGVLNAPMTDRPHREEIEAEMQALIKLYTDLIEPLVKRNAPTAEGAVELDATWVATPVHNSTFTMEQIYAHIATMKVAAV